MAMKRYRVLLTDEACKKLPHARRFSATPHGLRLLLATHIAFQHISFYCFTPVFRPPILAFISSRRFGAALRMLIGHIVTFPEPGDDWPMMPRWALPRDAFYGLFYFSPDYRRSFIIAGFGILLSIGFRLL